MEFLLAAQQQELGEEMLEQQRREREDAIRRGRLRQLRDASNPFEYRCLYRLSRDLTRRLIEDLRPFLREGVRPTAVPLELTVLCALNFYGHGSYQKSVGSSHHLGLSQPSVSKAIAAVTEAL
ncbi:Putative nuclease [Frankliniella fusca]|uniref:Nuclease n=1 Tax=Frankliniella fusca TaxID=407009 RepID=A0AAE1L848_9NEOP|nr:Putative nuclease [Frankliniella fusca]